MINHRGLILSETAALSSPITIFGCINKQGGRIACNVGCGLHLLSSAYAWHDSAGPPPFGSLVWTPHRAHFELYCSWVLKNSSSSQGVHA